MKTLALTACALFAFACNSILCRLALRGGEADAAGFAGVRLLSGAVTLGVLGTLLDRRSRRPPRLGGDWAAAIALFLYALCFSLAYRSLSAGTGALILFGAVQVTMITVAIVRGDGPGPREWLGLAAAGGGLVYLVFPGLSAPPLGSSLLMAAAGAAWGAYTLRGTGSRAPLADTAGNFTRALPFAAAAAAAFWPGLHLSGRGLILAVASGTLASGVGYVLWYAALRALTPTRAAVVQLAVPIIAAVLGVVLLDEAAGWRLGLAAMLILGGVGLTIASRRHAPAHPAVRGAAARADRAGDGRR